MIRVEGFHCLEFVVFGLARFWRPTAHSHWVPGS